MTREQAAVAAQEAATYLAEEADFNRSWTDGRRGGERPASAAYIARRIELAEQREAWAAAINLLAVSTCASEVSPATNGDHP